MAVKTRREYIAFGDLRIDERTQRKIITARVNYLIANWDPGKVGTIHVSGRDNGYYIIDGQHRVRAAMEQGLGTTKVRCDVETTMDVSEEAEHFLSDNDVRAVSPHDKYRVALTAGREAEVGVERILRARALEMGTDSKNVRCPAQVLTIFRKDGTGELLGNTLDVVLEAWGHRPEALEAQVLRGISGILGKYNGELDREVLVRKLAKYRGGPGGLVGNARGLSDVRHISVGGAVIELIRDEYNRTRRGSSRLD